MIYHFNMLTLGCARGIYAALLLLLTPSILAQQINGTHFDYVILGGGTAGLVVAGRLSENPNITVAVVEAGNFERTNPNVTSPSGLGLAKDTRVDWQYESLPDSYGSNQSLIWSAGKGLGGSSLINGTTSSRSLNSSKIC
jgi:choline dehydrogenase-like flavoprotein